MKSFSVSLVVLLLGCGSIISSYASQSWNYTYNTSGQILTEDGPRTDVSDINTYTYNAQGNRASFINPLNQIVNYTSYDAAGRLLSMTDANGITTLFTYHARGWLTSSTIKHPSNNTAFDLVTTYSYDAVGQMTGMLLPNGTSLIYEYDDARRLKTVANSLGERIDYTLDAAGNRTAETIKDSSGTIRYSVARAFDELSRVRDITGNNNQHEQLGYDVNDNNTTVTDGNSHTTAQQYDALNRITKVIDPAQNETQFTYNAQGQIETVTDAKGLITSYHYDDLGNLTSLISPDTGVTTFTYDNAGNRTSATDSRGVVVNYTYDPLNRLTQVQYPASPAEDITYTYDATANGNYGVGRLTGIASASNTTLYTYNFQGLTTAKQTTVNSITRTTAYTYDAAGQLTGITYPSGRVVTYTRNSLGQISGVTTRASSGASEQIMVSNLGYLPFGPAVNYTYGNGLTLTHTYDQDYRLNEIEVSGIMDRDYVYDPVNNITGIINNLDTGKSQGYGYDALNRLTSATGIYGLLGYTYDAVGNRLSQAHNDGTQQRNDTYIYAATSHRLFGISRLTDNQADGTRSFTYDNAGNRLTGTAEDGSAQSHSYNHANRMSSVSVDSTAAASYSYNPLGQRISKIFADNTQAIYHYDEAGQLVSVTDGSGTTLREYIYLESQQVAFVNNGTLYYIHNDHLNTPQVITDQSQQVVWMADYQPFGKLVGAQTNSIELYSRFPGQYLDSESGLYYNYFRDYDPSIGRYIQSDPIGLDGGINTYAYVEGNPLRYSDPLGLAPNKGCVLTYTAAGATIGGAIGYGGGFVGGGAAGAFAGGVGAIPGAAGGSQLGGVAGAAAGSGTGYMIAQWVCPDDDDDAQPIPSNPPAPNDNSECERQCDLEWDRDKFMCDSVGAMHGFSSKAYKNCRDRIDTKYVECYQDCSKEECP